MRSLPREHHNPCDFAVTHEHNPSTYCYHCLIFCGDDSSSLNHFAFCSVVKMRSLRPPCPCDMSCPFPFLSSSLSSCCSATRPFSRLAVAFGRSIVRVRVQLKKFIILFTVCFPQGWDYPPPLNDARIEITSSFSFLLFLIFILSINRLLLTWKVHPSIHRDI